MNHLLTSLLCYMLYCYQVKIIKQAPERSLLNARANMANTIATTSRCDLNFLAFRKLDLHLEEVFCLFLLSFVLYTILCNCCAPEKHLNTMHFMEPVFYEFVKQVLCNLIKSNKWKKVRMEKKKKKDRNCIPQEKGYNFMPQERAEEFAEKPFYFVA